MCTTTIGKNNDLDQYDQLLFLVNHHYLEPLCLPIHPAIVDIHHEVNGVITDRQTDTHTNAQDKYSNPPVYARQLSHIDIQICSKYTSIKCGKQNRIFTCLCT